MNINRSEFVPLDPTATRLGVPATWLKAEAEAGRIPCLRAGRRLLFKPELVAEELTRRSIAATQEAAPHA